MAVCRQGAGASYYHISKYMCMVCRAGNIKTRQIVSVIKSVLSQYRGRWCMHRIPWNKDTERKQWLRFLRGTGTDLKLVNKNSTVCSLHFPPGIRQPGMAPNLFHTEQVLNGPCHSVFSVLIHLKVYVVK